MHEKNELKCEKSCQSVLNLQPARETEFGERERVISQSALMRFRADENELSSDRARAEALPSAK